MSKEYLSVTEVAKELDYTVQHTRLLIRSNKIKGEKIGRDWLVLRESVSEYTLSRNAILRNRE